MENKQLHYRDCQNQKKKIEPAAQQCCVWPLLYLACEAPGAIPSSQWEKAIFAQQVTSISVD